MSDKPFQRIGSASNTHVGNDFEQAVSEFFASQGIPLKRNHRVEVGFAGKRKEHAFDLGCDDQRVIVECKSHRWTSGDNIPSAKITVWNEVMLYFLVSPPFYRKILCVLNHRSERRKESLAEYYVRIYSHLIPAGVEIWEFDDVSGQGAKVFPL